MRASLLGGRFSTLFPTPSDSASLWGEKHDLRPLSPRMSNSACSLRSLDLEVSYVHVSQGLLSRCNPVNCGECICTDQYRQFRFWGCAHRLFERLCLPDTSGRMPLRRTHAELRSEPWLRMDSGRRPRCTRR